MNHQPTMAVHFKDGEDMDSWQPMQLQAVEINISETAANNHEAIFIPTWENRPIEAPPIITLNDVGILTDKNLMAIIASPGVGKSSICESIVANILNREADCLGFKVSDHCHDAIYIDFERTNLDVWNSFNRMNKRAGVKYGEETPGVILAGMRSIPRLKERLEAIVFLLENNPCDLLLLDGAGDLVTDTNDLLQAIECRIFLRELTVKYNVSIFTTLHPNPGSFKPRGHIGGEITREVECCLLAKTYEGDCRIITSEFDYGKNRNNAPIQGGYKWSDEKKMFISVDIEQVSPQGKKDVRAAAKLAYNERIAKVVLAPPTALKNGELIKAIMKMEGNSKATAKRILDNLIDMDIISKSDDGYYRFIV